jgi:hypothetical protein
MIKLLERISDIKLKYMLIDITSIFEQRLSQGTRHIIHMEAFISRLIHLFTTHQIDKNIETNLEGTKKLNNLDVLEI